ncbi:MAG TPA: hypothetical protein VH025_06285 [Solirubrobacteraceae bacterium]|nr:hypothetical protein [Solirubrobacteraceae bacterium]
MYHLELTKFPHSASRFNLSEADIARVVIPWVQEKWVEFGERRWDPHESKLVVLEGPELPVRELKIGRGWRAAERKGVDVTERVLAGAREAIRREQQQEAEGHATAAATAGDPVVSPSAQALSVQAAAGADPLALAVRVGSLLGPDAERLLEAWREAALASPGTRPSESLAAAERALAPE